jgi:hypothetical protein
MIIEQRHIYIDTNGKPPKEKDNKKVVLIMLIAVLLFLLLCVTMFAFLLIHPEKAPAVFGTIFEKLAATALKRRTVCLIQWIFGRSNACSTNPCMNHTSASQRSSWLSTPRLNSCPKSSPRTLGAGTGEAPESRT